MSLLKGSLSSTAKAALRERVLESMQSILALRGDLLLLVQRQRQRTHVCVAPRMRNDLLVESHESVQSGGGRCDPCFGPGIDEGRKRLKCLPCVCLRCRHALLHARHHGLVSISNMGGLEHLNLPNR